MQIPPIWPIFRPTDERKRPNVKKALNATFQPMRKELRILEVPKKSVSLYGRSGVYITKPLTGEKTNDLV